VSATCLSYQINCRCSSKDFLCFLGNLYWWLYWSIGLRNASFLGKESRRQWNEVSGWFQ